MTSKVAAIKNQLASNIKDSKNCDSWFYEEHILVVEKLAMDLCNRYKAANKNAVTLMVYFHDIGRIYGHDEDHDVYGADYAKRLTLPYN